MRPLDELSESEQTKFAARAIGLTLFWDSFSSLPPASDPPFVYWDPKHDDGDSLRLAVSLDMQIEHLGKVGGPTTKVQCWPRGRSDCAVIHAYDGDKLAATRLAVFESAALAGIAIEHQSAPRLQDGK
jgi:hypothetical protein